MLQRKLFFFSSMESSSSLSFLSQQMPPPVTSRTIIFSSISSCWKQKRPSIQISAVSYRKFIHFALDETKRHTHLAPSPLQERFNSIISMDGEVELQMTSFEAPKIRLLRSLSIETETMQVLDFGVFPKPEYDVPIFCANFFTSGNTNIILLDLNPLHDVINQREYKEKYYKSLMPLGVKYAELLPWGGKLTSESLKFFSPIVLWTKFASSEYKHDVLFSAFMDYYKAWLHLMEGAVEETDPSGIKCNREAQHRYLTWRAEKDLKKGFCLAIMLVSLVLKHTGLKCLLV
ncbi:phytochromobilin:ferredoxin oxidoreductase, chloroplastic isoform X2 [Ziziphus jujuba]|uniref:Phytochromobilin:ferredoxin oxidoreductase, chloroplastic isoform X2 n=1 Tax=Ziziphus jujuba TaxID=326968 RepID=A0ABM3ZU53_ZIZJJ|nr:phytochromobilin:ferredoxin oxidoreductase, chloroplastic isoform X2 [Ziziphus jujuba]